jgi:hypothetical protein
MPMTQDEFDHQRGLLSQTIGALVGAFVYAFPEGFFYDPEAHLIDSNAMKITGTASEDPMRSIASKIYDVMEAFDLMQKGLGLHDGEEPRFERFLKGECNQP